MSDADAMIVQDEKSAPHASAREPLARRALNATTPMTMDVSERTESAPTCEIAVHMFISDARTSICFSSPPSPLAGSPYLPKA